MKKLMIISVLLLVSFVSFSQDTIQKKLMHVYIVSHQPTEEELAFDLKYDYNNRSWGTKDTVREYNYVLRVDREYISSVYMERAGKNFIGGGVFLGLSVGSLIVPMFVTDITPNTTKILYGVGGACLISSVAFLISGGNNLKKSAVVLRSNKKYILETNGTNIKIRF